MSRTIQWMTNILLFILMFTIFGSCKTNAPSPGLVKSAMETKVDILYAKVCRLQSIVERDQATEIATLAASSIPNFVHFSLSESNSFPAKDTLPSVRVGTAVLPPMRGWGGIHQAACKHIWVESLEDTTHDEISLDGFEIYGPLDILLHRDEDYDSYSDGVSLVCVRCFKERKQVNHVKYKKCDHPNLFHQDSNIDTLYSTQ